MTDVRLKEIASKTEGFTGADLKALLYSAQLQAAHEALERKKKESEREHRVSQHSLSELSPAAALMEECDMEEEKWTPCSTAAIMMTFQSTRSGVEDCEDKSQLSQEALLTKVCVHSQLLYTHIHVVWCHTILFRHMIL